MTAERVGFVGLRIADRSTYAATVRLYRDVLGLDVTAVDRGSRSSTTRSSATASSAPILTA